MPALEASGFEMIVQADPAAIPKSSFDLVVIDHYALDVDYESLWRARAGKILVLDDLANRAHDCDILVDQTFGRSPDDYKGLVLPGCALLCGSDYALLRPQFFARRAESLQRRTEGHIGRLLVNLGGSDPNRLTLTVLDSLKDISRPLTIDIVVGASMMPHLHNEIVHRARAMLQHETTVYAGVEDMAALMAKADLAIGAGGTTSWERCTLGLPSLLIEVADNQHLIVQNLHKAGAATPLGLHTEVTPEIIKNSLLYHLERPSVVLQMGQAAAAICDGLGTARVVETIEKICVS